MLLKPASPIPSNTGSLRWFHRYTEMGIKAPPYILRGSAGRRRISVLLLGFRCPNLIRAYVMCQLGIPLTLGSFSLTDGSSHVPCHTHHQLGIPLTLGSFSLTDGSSHVPCHTHQLLGIPLTLGSFSLTDGSSHIPCHTHQLAARSPETQLYTFMRLLCVECRTMTRHLSPYSQATHHYIDKHCFELSIRHG